MIKISSTTVYFSDSCIVSDLYYGKLHYYVYRMDYFIKLFILFASWIVKSQIGQDCSNLGNIQELLLSMKNSQRNIII